MKKLKIVCKDKSQITYTMRDFMDHMLYFNRHSIHSIESAILHKYPLKHNEPIKLV
jgi:hypothetical protein